MWCMCVLTQVIKWLDITVVFLQFVQLYFWYWCHLLGDWKGIQPVKNLLPAIPKAPSLGNLWWTQPDLEWSATTTKSSSSRSRSCSYGVVVVFVFLCRRLIIHCKLFSAVSEVQVTRHLTNISLQWCLIRESSIILFVDFEPIWCYPVPRWTPCALYA